ncbi:MAG: hypothetical protein RLZZ528_1909 [Pseudomonadota bacterium]
MSAGPLSAFDGLSGIESLADIGGQGGDLVAEAVARWDCAVTLVDLGPDGTFPEAESGWVAPYRDRMAALGVAADRIRVVRRREDLRPVDLVVNLSAFGDAFRIRHLTPVLERCFHSDSRMILDIRKGSGGFPFLREYGSTEVVEELSRDGHAVTRARFMPKPPPEVVGNDDAWAEIARGLAGPEGFYRDNGMHSFLFIPRGRTLVVTFDNLDIAMGKREERRPWGFAFIERQGWSMLGVMANGWTWYRDPWVAAEFDRLAAEGFFARFDRVVFYGASMGGYAAAAFVAACPGADVVTISPQSTLDRALVPWETRYRMAWDRDFSGKYGDAAVASDAARRVTILFDPYEALDAGHVNRFSGGNVMKLRTPLMGHRLGSSLNQMGILTPVILSALDGSLTETGFYRALRARREFPRYQRELFQKAVARGRKGLARRVAAWVLARGENRAIRAALRGL